MNLRQLHYFVGIAEAGSMTAAADRLHVAQSALSLQVRNLEGKLGVKLFVREPGGVRLTAAGCKFMDHARLILGAVRDAEAAMRDVRHRPSGQVKLGVPAGVARILNAPLLDAAPRQLPDIDLYLVEMPAAHAHEWVADGIVDVGVVYDLDDRPSDTLLAQEEMYLVTGAPQLGLDQGITLAELARIPLVMPTCIRNPQHCIVTYASARGIELAVERRVDSLATILELVINRSGAAVLCPCAFLPEWHAGRVFAYPLRPAVHRSVRVAASPSRVGEPAVEAVKKLIAEVTEASISNGNWLCNVGTKERSAA